ncbi:probable multidrug resistance-associated protein lethal(2)03659 isoform X2 [Aethina tumida]|uniref:probable multidrug resistance-associated protein lethal(2)03659 isoform X2 n=1 Tax=Aethina tumida TaxID=116153 RepID=UPI0021497A66|nr:probable multidrug resistance-associated protein lethal(2)03659 isoform X2 [Aethina tumida]
MPLRLLFDLCQNGPYFLNWSRIDVSVYFANIVVNMRLKMNKKTDDRLQIMQEVLSAIKIIKMYTWEKCFDNKVTEARRKELIIMLKTFYIRVVVILIGLLSSKISFYVLIMVYLWFGHTTDVEMVFYILTCVEGLRNILAIDIPYGLSRGADMYAALLRISKVLNSEEVQDHANLDKTEKPIVELCNVSVSIKERKVLRRIDLRVESGLVLVTGTVGCGKSSLIKTLLRDYPPESGVINVRGSISYASQDPWLFPSSVKQNILFGQTYDGDRYKEVVRVCALEYDFDCLDHGDETIVADRGLNLSKGQQARINLARAVYKDSNIYLLDDSLTALDANIQDYIFNECIKHFLKDKLVVLVTQCESHMAMADKILKLDQGKIIYYGEPVHKSSYIISSSIKGSNSTEVNKDKESCEESPKAKVYQETKRQGVVELKTFLSYFKFGGGFWVLFGIVIMCIFAQSTDSYSSKLITDWVDENQVVVDLAANGTTNTTEYQENVDKANFTINMYSGSIFLLMIMDMLRVYCMLNFSRLASLNIHKAMTSSIINAVMPFFDNHFIGNILNRFSQDLNNVDEQVSFILLDMMKVVFEVGGIIFVMTAVNWRFLMPAILFIIVSYVIRQLYMPAGRSLKRLEAATRSPLIGHLNSSLEGLTTIRAYKAQDILREEFDRHQDLFTSAHFMMLCTSRAFAYIVDSCCTLLITFIVVRFLFFETDTSAGDVGLVLTQVMALSDSVQYAIRYYADLENQMTSVERVLEYTEAKTETKAGDVLEDWPKRGRVQFENVSLTYSNNETVLRNISFTVEARQKIGIVGRTGAGKSSIISTLFRLYELEGKIIIDGIDTKTLSLEFLRQSIAIIPQDPVLFSGSMRYNIDPTGKYTDKQIWEVLEKVNLKPVIDTLEYEIVEKGSNFSSGQKQLICLARAIIRKNRIVVLDEATANMDPKTDALLHDTVKENFKDCTIFVIAHRLHSVIDADQIMVLNRGEIVECDVPSKLLENKNGYFFQMVQKSKI